MNDKQTFHHFVPLMVLFYLSILLCKLLFRRKLARAERDGASLIKPRYHFFVRALEGAYITLTAPKRLYL